MKKKIYISIPISGKSEAAQRERAAEVKAELVEQGWDVVNPFEIYVGKDAFYADYLAADIRALMDCDAIYMCEGWEESCGCTIEYGVAKTLSEFERKCFQFIYE